MERREGEMTIDARVKALSEEKAFKAVKVIEETPWTEEQLQEAGIEFCTKHPEVSLVRMVLEVPSRLTVPWEEKETIHISFGVCVKCERGISNGKTPD